MALIVFYVLCDILGEIKDQQPVVMHFRCGVIDTFVEKLYRFYPIG